MGKNKIIFSAFLILFFSCFLSFGKLQAAEKTDTVNLHIFYGQGCPHCASLLAFAEDLKSKYPVLNVREHEIYFNEEERDLFEKAAEKFKIEIEGVPTAFIADKAIAGFSSEIGENLEKEIKKCVARQCPDIVGEIESENDKNPENNPASSQETEKNNVKKLTVPIVIGAAAVDAINPCAFAVLIILMTVALSIADKKRALKFGLAFTLSIYISYFLMGLGLFSALQAAKLSHGFYFFVTILAVLVGILNIKDYFWYGKGFLMEIPLSWRPKMKKIIGSATSPLGAFLVGFAVSLFELPCTGGPYIVILGLLAQEMTKISGIYYLLLYNLVFVAPLIILTFIIYKGISTTEKLERIRQGKIRILHLIAGIIMLAIAGGMIISIIKGWV